MVSHGDDDTALAEARGDGVCLLDLGGERTDGDEVACIHILGLAAVSLCLVVLKLVAGRGDRRQVEGP